MLGLLYLVLHVIIYSTIGTVFYKLRARFSLIPFYFYLGVLELLVTILNSVYLFEIKIFDISIMLGGGNIVYSAVIWCIMLLYLMERDPELIQFVIYCLIILQLFFLIFYPLVVIIMADPLTTNPLLISPELFQTSFWIFVVGNLLQLVELFIMVILFERSNKIKILNDIPWQLRVVFIYIFVLILDGILFPFLAFPVTQSISVVRGIEAILGKCLLGIGFGSAMLIVISVLKSEYADKPLDSDLSILQLISLPKFRMVKRIRTAEENEAMVRLLLDLLSHDIRNYITTTSGYLELVLETSELAESTREMLEHVERIQLESTILVQNILALNKIQERVLQPEEVHLRTMFEQAVMNTQKIYPNIPLVVENQDCLNDIYVNVHPLLAEIFYNLLTNAIRHRKPEQETVTIDLAVRSEENKIYLSISDKGKGIPDERKETIFKRVDKLSYKKGIGLYIVKSILKYFQGNIWVENRAETPQNYTSGSVFQLVLPKVPSRSYQSGRRI